MYPRVGEPRENRIKEDLELSVQTLVKVANRGLSDLPYFALTAATALLWNSVDREKLIIPIFQKEFRHARVALEKSGQVTAVPHLSKIESHG
jgi:hypothetical protein